MTDRVPPFIAALAAEPDFQATVTDLFKTVYGQPDALDLKTKYLIGFALDAAVGGAGGVKNIAAMARGVGATEAELLSVTRLCFAAAGFQRLITCMAGLDREAAADAAAGSQ